MDKYIGLDVYACVYIQERKTTNTCACIACICAVIMQYLLIVIYPYDVKAV